MIRYLRLENFRRHESSEISLSDGGQIVLIAGANGVGKSTVVEAILYGLYGEGRHGTRHLDRMIRRGAELEGMEVELEFDLADTIYRVKRRRDNKISSAVLFGNDVALVEGAREVTREITNLLGMDSRGFRLAVVAQQKELDGLASMRPGDRAAMLSRLLRFDAVGVAKDRARAIFRSERDALRGLGEIDDPAAKAQEISQLEGELTGLSEIAAQTRAAIAGIDETVGALADEEARFHLAHEREKRQDALCEGAASDLARLESELASLGEVPAPREYADPMAVAEALSRVDAELAVVASNRRLDEQARMVREELVVVRELIASKQQILDGLIVPADEIDIDSLKQKTHEAKESLERCSDELSRAQGEYEGALARRVSLDGLEAVCETCGQEISHEHVESQISLVEARIESLGELTESLTKRRDELVEALAASTKAREIALEESRLQEQRQREAESLENDIRDLWRRVETYEDQLSRIEVEEIDDSALLVRRGELAMALGEAQAEAEAETARRLVLERRRLLEREVELAKERNDGANELRRMVAVEEELRQAHARYQSKLEARANEVALLSEITTQIAVAQETLSGLNRELDRVTAQQTRRRELEKAAWVASECANVLEATSTQLNQQIRPSLEGTVGELLSRLSDGRFDAVSLDQDYNLSVRDGGAFRPLGDFSGGEIDLIALSMRLGLAGVVSAQHGAGGAGFLILDECFGSQDHERRGSILNALRGLRGVYGQILLISHVGGLEDSADRVIEVVLDKESGVACASVA